MVWNAFARGTAWDLWRDLYPIQSQVNRIFSDLSGDGTRESPAVAVWSGENGARLQAQLPGMGAEDFELTVVDDTVTLKGKRPGSDSSAGATLHRQERDAGQFIRTIQLPFGVEGDQVQARLQNGVLEVDLPRATSEKPRKITVKSA